LKKPSYSLAKVLEHKNFRATQLKKELAELTDVYENTRIESENHKQRYQNSLKLGSQENYLKPADIQLTYAYRDFLRSSLNEVLCREEKAAKDLAAAKQRWIEGQLEVRMLERHRENEQKSFSDHQDRLTQSTLDEIAVNLYHRRR